MTDMQQDKKTTQKSGQSIGFMRASEKMFIATFEIPLTFFEDIGVSKERTQPLKDFNRRFIGGFYARMRGIGERLSFSGAKKEARKEPARVRKAETEKPAKPAKAATAAEPTERAARPKAQVKARKQTESAKPETTAP